jgi:hypothetical protein
MKIYIYEYSGYYEAGVAFVANRELLESDARDMRMSFEDFKLLGIVDEGTLAEEFRAQLINNDIYFVYHGG